MITDKDVYLTKLAEIEPALAQTGPSWLHSVRRAAREQFAEHGFPTTKDEEWRFTRIRPLLQHDFGIAVRPATNGVSAKDLTSAGISGGDLRTLVFVNGHYAPELSDPGTVDGGLRVSNLREALETDPERLEQHLASCADPAKNPFVALNTAHVMDGAFVFVPRGVSVAEAIHLVFVSTGGDTPLVSHPRNLIIIDNDARASVLESYLHTNDAVYFTNPVTELVVGDHGQLDHYKLQNESPAAYHIGALHARIGANSRVRTTSLSLGGTLVRNDVGALLDGEGTDCTLDGLYLADGHQHVDNHTNIDHAKPHCDSHELYKGILGGRAKAVFNGRIHVHPDAQKTDAKQSNRCILLSDDAQINTNPQLEIYADDVKCTHGAAVGQIDETAVFYLRSRGISRRDARRMLVYAFANEIIEKITVEPLRAKLSGDLFTWLTRVESSHA